MVESVQNHDYTGSNIATSLECRELALDFANAEYSHCFREASHSFSIRSSSFWETQKNTGEVTGQVEKGTSKQPNLINGRANRRSLQPMAGTRHPGPLLAPFDQQEKYATSYHLSVQDKS